MKISTHNNTTTTVLLAILSVAIIASISAASTADEPCKQPSGMWGDVDPNIFYICDTKTNTSQQIRCPEGRGFFNGLGYFGCIPYNQWPACTGSAVQQVCNTEFLMQPWETLDPNKFFMCLAEAVAPVLVNCELGKGFVNAPAGEASKIVGCAKWEKWREYMQCTDYY